jgi:hypothetical protein
LRAYAYDLLDFLRWRRGTPQPTPLAQLTESTLLDCEFSDCFVSAFSDCFGIVGVRKGEGGTGGGAGAPSGRFERVDQY